MMQKTLNKLRKTKRNLQYSLQEFIQSFNQSDEIINEKEMRVVGMKRSGNHAIIHWIWQQQGDGVTHLNNVPVKQNPYRFLYEHFPTDRLKREASGKFAKKDLLIYSYEDQKLEDIVDLRFEQKQDLYLGKSLKRYDILILRDPFNCYASRLKMLYKSQQSEPRSLDIQRKSNLVSQESVSIWISYAKEFLGETNYLKNHKVCINYNSWCTDIDYRKNLAKELDLEFSDAGRDRVKGQGGGSSFDGLSKNYEGSTMQVDQRWEMMAEDPIFLEIIKNRELLEYSSKIFGESFTRTVESQLLVNK